MKDLLPWFVFFYPNSQAVHNSLLSPCLCSSHKILKFRTQIFEGFWQNFVFLHPNFQAYEKLS